MRKTYLHFSSIILFYLVDIYAMAANALPLLNSLTCAVTHHLFKLFSADQCMLQTDWLLPLADEHLVSSVGAHGPPRTSVVPYVTKRASRRIFVLKLIFLLKWVHFGVLFENPSGAKFSHTWNTFIN